MPHAVADSVSDSSMLASDISGFVLSFSNLFDQCKAICRCGVCGMNAVARGLTRGRGIDRL